MDLHVSVCAVLLAEACKISLTEVAQPSMPALSYNRLAWVSQNYVRAETIAAANEHLLGVYAHIPLVQDVRIVGDDWTHACEFVAQEDPPDFSRAPAYVRTSLPVPSFGWGTIPDQYGRLRDDDQT